MSLSDEKRRYIDSIDKEETYDFYSEEKVKKHTQAFIEECEKHSFVEDGLRVIDLNKFKELAEEEFGDKIV